MAQIRVILCTLALLVVPVALLAQQPTQEELMRQLPPGVSPEQAAQLLQQRPELAALFRQRLAQSGMTSADVRARLRSAGYPSSMLDAYLGPDTATTPPSEQMVSAASTLGIASFSVEDSLRLRGDTLALRMHRDSLRADSLAVAEALDAGRRGLELFGLDVFRRATTRFQPMVTGPVDDTYILGPGDELVLILTGDVQAAHTMEVTRGGFVVIPNVGQVNVTNLSLGQLRELLYDRLARFYSGISRRPSASTKFEVTVTEVRVLQVRVVGEVAQPGAFQLAATGTVLSALYDAGGLTPRSNFRAVEVRRGERLIATVDLYDYLLRGVVPAEVRLASGDVVFVPVRGPRVKIAGEVTRPGIYEIVPGETIRDLVGIAGGFTPEAATETATIDRIIPPEERTERGLTRTVLSVNLAAAMLDGGRAAPLFAGDSVTVYRIAGGRRNAVTIAGSVWQPGTYRLEPGMRLSDLVGIAGGLRPDAYTGRAQILRTHPDSTKQLIGIAIAGPEGDGFVDDPVLRELDEVSVFSSTDFRPLRYISVQGAVQRPGAVVFADSMTLRDAILLAGGLTEDAYLAEAEISRINRAAAQGDSLAVVLKTPLDATFVSADGGYVPRPAGDEPAPTVVLQPYDYVFVRTQPGWERPSTVALTGEVLFPGQYTLLHRDERLMDLVMRAGGLTPQAYASGIRFFRLGRDTLRASGSTTVQADPTVPSSLVSEAGGRPTGASWATPETLGDVLPGPADRVWGGPARVGIDMAAVLKDPSHHDNVVLAAGDSIDIPRYIPFVRVEGAVNSPGNVPYRNNWSIDRYVHGAGGFHDIADEGKAYVQQPNGILQTSGSPEPGAVVVVPEKDLRETDVSFWQAFALVSPIIASLTTMVVVIVSQ
jgi:protein involved in polysaccharide export with SLBB domain